MVRLLRVDRPSGRGVFPDEYLYEKLGLLRLEKLTSNLPWANT